MDARIQPRLLDMLQAALQTDPDAPAFTCLGQTLSHGEVDAQSHSFASWLQLESGLLPGDRVALLLPNLLPFPVVALGVLRAGMVLVNLNPRYTPMELQELLQDSGARLLVAVDACGLDGVLANTCVDTLALIHVANRHARPGDCKTIGLYEVLRHGRSLAGFTLPARGGGLALLQYTGGTTGMPKAAMLSHANLAANLLQLQQRFAGDYPAPASVMVAPLPLYHIYAFSISLLGGLLHRHHTLLIPNPRDMEAVISALRPWRINGIVGIETLYGSWCAHAPLGTLDFSALRLCSAGGMALSGRVAGDWRDMTGCDIVEGYGLSECAPLVACNIPGDNQQETVGRLLPGTELLLVDAAGSPLTAGQPGEICVRGPQVMSGYWQRPDENRRVLDADGWLHTGDIGIVEEGGRLRLLDRLKDMIIVSGFKVYPVEVERHACRHPGIKDACAVAGPPGGSGGIVLFVVAGDPGLDAKAVLEWCRQGLAAYKLPRRVEFRSSLPCTALGKPLRRLLREQLLVPHATGAGSSRGISGPDADSSQGSQAATRIQHTGTSCPAKDTCRPGRCG